LTHLGVDSPESAESIKSANPPDSSFRMEDPLVMSPAGHKELASTTAAAAAAVAPATAAPVAPAPAGDSPYEFLREFDTIFLIDDSGSMAGRSWRETAAAISATYDAPDSFHSRLPHSTNFEKEHSFWEHLRRWREGGGAYPRPVNSCLDSSTNVTTTQRDRPLARRRGRGTRKNDAYWKQRNDETGVDEKVSATGNRRCCMLHG
jgi:hypothetical protein